MRITATYHEDGKLDLPAHIKTKHHNIQVVVDFPEEELEVEDYIELIENESVRRMMSRLRTIRGTGPLLSDEDKKEYKSDGELLRDAFSRLKQEGRW